MRALIRKGCRLSVTFADDVSIAGGRRMVVDGRWSAMDIGKAGWCVCYEHKYSSLGGEGSDVSCLHGSNFFVIF